MHLFARTPSSLHNVVYKRKRGKESADQRSRKETRAISFWTIVGLFLIRQVDITLVHHYPHTHHKDQLMSATARLKVKVSELHAGQNGYLEISCWATIPNFPMYHEQFADIRKKTVSGECPLVTFR